MAVRFAGTVGAAVSAVLLLTVTVTFEVACVFPAASRAMAERTCEPFGEVRVSQATVYGATVSSAPRFEPSSLNWTPATPTLSDASALTDTVPETVALAAGAVTATEGLVVSETGGGAEIGVFMSL